MAMTKSFKDKLDKQFNNLSIDKPKVAKYIEHVYADFFELNALFSKDEVTLADISDLLNDVKDSNIIETEIDDLSFNEIASLNSEKNDKISDRILAIFQICKFRKTLFDKDEYPFEVGENSLIIKVDLNTKQRMYLFLLLSSNLNYFENFESILTKDFELMSFFSLESFLPHKAIVKSFGKNTEYSGNTLNKISVLSQELGIKLNYEKVNCISKNNNQERGLDIIAWMPYTDGISNMLVFLCQCACGKNWDLKQNDTEFFSKYFYFDNTPIHCLFIPFALSNLEGQFMQYDRILKNLIFDRKRILEQFNETIFFNNCQSFHIIEKCIKTRINLN
jgi:hypothetical protein